MGTWYASNAYFNREISRFLSWAKLGLFLFIFSYFSQLSSNTILKSIDVVLGIRTRGCRMVDADGSIDLWGLARDTTNLKHSSIKSIDVVLGIRNCGCRMVDADGSIDQWGLARDTTNFKHSSIKYTMNRQRIKA